MDLMLAAAFFAAHLTFSHAQGGSGDLENSTADCSLSLYALLWNSTINSNSIDRVHVCATTLSLQSNRTQFASVVAVYGSRAHPPSSGGPVAASLELQCRDDGEWIVTSEWNCSLRELFA